MMFSISATQGDYPTFTVLKMIRNVLRVTRKCQAIVELDWCATVDTSQQMLLLLLLPGRWCRRTYGTSA